MHRPLPHARRRRRGLRVALAGAIAVGSTALAGCYNIGTITEADLEAAECSMPAASAEPAPPVLPEVTAADLGDPLAIDGPTTAIPASADIVPVSDDPAASQQLPVDVESADGTVQTVTDTSRILALNQNGGLAAAVIGLGFGCNLVGRDVSTASNGLDALPLVTMNGHQLNAESILALSPTVVITDSTIGPYDVQLQLRDAGIPVVFIDAAAENGIEGVPQQLEDVAAALGVAELGERLAERTTAEIDATIAGVAALAPADEADRPGVVFLYLRGRSTYYWFGEGSGADSLIRAISARDVAAEVGFEGMLPTNAEALIAASPDAILSMTLGVASVGGVDDVFTLPGIAETPAGTHRRLIDMSDYEVLSFGPRTAQVIAALGIALYAPEYATGAQSDAITERLDEIEAEQEADG